MYPQKMSTVNILELQKIQPMTLVDVYEGIL